MDAIHCCIKAIDLFALGDYSEALAYFDDAIKSDPKYEKAWYYKGLLLKLMDRQVEADYVFNDIAKRVDFSAMVNFNDLEQCIQALEHLDKGEPSQNDVIVRWVAAEILGELKYAKGVGPLIRSLQNDENFSVRWRAANALGKIGDPRAVEPLIQALKDEKLDVRGYAAIALGRIGEIHALPYLYNPTSCRQGIYCPT
jgi:HEAT repeat protein